MNARLFPVVRALTFVALALIACAIVFQLAGYPSAGMFAAIAEGAFLAPHAIVHTIRWAMPLFVAALGVLVAFRCGYFNIGAQGQFYAGAIAAGLVADYGTRFIVVAGLLNVIAAVDAHNLRTGRKS